MIGANTATLATSSTNIFTALGLIGGNTKLLEGNVSSLITAEANIYEALGMIGSNTVSLGTTHANIYSTLGMIGANTATLATSSTNIFTALGLIGGNTKLLEGNVSSLITAEANIYEALGMIGGNTAGGVAANIMLAGNFQTAGNVTFIGAYDSIFTLTGTTSLILPTSGTLITSSSAETLTNKTIYSSTMSGNMTVSDNLIANGNVTLGQTSADNITINGNLSINDGILYTGSIKPKRTIVLTSEGATLGTTGNATRTLIDGTGYSYYVLEYPLTATGNAYWNWIMPDSYDGGTVDVSLYWNSGGSSTNSAHWAVATGSINEGTVLGSALSGTGNILKASQGDSKMTISNLSISNPGWSAGNLTIFRVYRDLNTDTLAATANLLRVKIEYSVNNESD
jgi:TM2 domain-containing membrane protein YozV